MLRPNYNSMFKRICQKLCNKNQDLLTSFADGESSADKMIKYSPFVAIKTINNLSSGNTDTESMNLNLDYLLQKWDF